MDKIHVRAEKGGKFKLTMKKVYNAESSINKKPT